MTAINSVDVRGFMQAVSSLWSEEREKDIDLVLHRPGGSLDDTEHIVKYLRHWDSFVCRDNLLTLRCWLFSLPFLSGESLVSGKDVKRERSENEDKECLAGSE